ncbi:hypothetical protein D3C85_1221270 [compost metagenome]
MHQTIGEGGVEDHRQPVHRHHAAVDDFEALRGLHPAVGGEDPEGGDDGADGHHHRREEVQARSHAVPAEQHDAEEAGLEEEGGEYLVGQQRPGDRAGKVGEGAPVGAELVGHDQAGDHAHAEVDGKDLRPEVIEVAVDLLPGLQPQPFQHREVAGQANGDGREDDVEGHGEGELHSGEIESLQSEHGDSSNQVDTGAGPARLHGFWNQAGPNCSCGVCCG